MNKVKWHVIFLNYPKFAYRHFYTIITCLPPFNKLVQRQNYEFEKPFFPGFVRVSVVFL
jgi:hypothetical protein